MIAERERGQLPRERATAMGAAEGDGFCHETARGRRIPPGFRLPRGFSWRPKGSSQPHAKGPPRKAGLQHKTMFACSSLQAQRVDRARRNASAALDALVLVDLSVVVDGQSAYRAGICASAARDAGILVNLYCHESSLLYTAPRGAVFSVAEKLLALYRPTLELVTDNIPKAPETPPSGHTIIWPMAV